MPSSGLTLTASPGRYLPVADLTLNDASNTWFEPSSLAALPMTGECVCPAKSPVATALD